MAIESLVRKKYFLTSEESECFASLSIEGAKYVVLKVFFNLFLKYFLNINKACLIFARSYLNALHYNAITKLSPPINKRLMDSSFFLGTLYK
jgi:hypothetical protein